MIIIIIIKIKMASALIIPMVDPVPKTWCDSQTVNARRGQHGHYTA